MEYSPGDMHAIQGLTLSGLRATRIRIYRAARRLPVFEVRYDLTVVPRKLTAFTNDKERLWPLWKDHRNNVRWLPACSGIGTAQSAHIRPCRHAGTAKGISISRCRMRRAGNISRA